MVGVQELLGDGSTGEITAVEARFIQQVLAFKDFSLIKMSVSYCKLGASRGRQETTRISIINDTIRVALEF